MFNFPFGWHCVSAFLLSYDKWLIWLMLLLPEVVAWYMNIEYLPGFLLLFLAYLFYSAQFHHPHHYWRCPHRKGYDYWHGINFQVHESLCFMKSYEITEMIYLIAWARYWSKLTAISLKFWFRLGRKIRPPDMQVSKKWNSTPQKNLKNEHVF